jgi:hypothetical protein
MYYKAAPHKCRHWPLGDSGGGSMNALLATPLAVLVERPEHLKVLGILVPLITFVTIISHESFSFILEGLLVGEVTTVGWHIR